MEEEFNEKVKYIEWFLTNNNKETINDYERFFDWGDMVDCQILITEEEYKNIFSLLNKGNDKREIITDGCENREGNEENGNNQEQTSIGA
jgi:hypothetical protein